MKEYLVIKDMKTKEEVHRIDVTGKSERNRDMCLMGLMRNMDLDNYFVDEVEE